MSTCKVDVRPAAPGDAEALLARGLRPSDEREAWKVAGIPPGPALRLTLAGSDMAASIFVDEVIVAMLGVCSSGVLTGTGAPWLLAHADFERRETAVCMGRISRRFINQWLTVFDRLENYADPEHEKSLGYLQWLGFNFDWDHPARGPLGHKIIRFWR